MKDVFSKIREFAKLYPHLTTEQLLYFSEENIRDEVDDALICQQKEINTLKTRVKLLETYMGKY